MHRRTVNIQTLFGIEFLHFEKVNSIFDNLFCTVKTNHFTQLGGCISLWRRFYNFCFCRFNILVLRVNNGVQLVRVPLVKPTVQLCNMIAVIVLKIIEKLVIGFDFAILRLFCQINLCTLCVCHILCNFNYRH